MDKNHSQNFSEEQLDKLVRNVLHSTILTDEEVDTIADSPRLWRQVQCRIADEKSQREKHWFFGWRWQALASGALAILIAAGAAFWLYDSAKTEIALTNMSDEKIVLPAEELKPFETSPVTPQSVILPGVQSEDSTVKTKRLLSKTLPKIKSARIQPAAQRLAKVKNAAPQKREISTEFIALTYLPATESGQVVRVKVPRSMMFSLGVTTNVEKNSELVSAEIILGDDGAARAIRFLGQ